MTYDPQSTYRKEPNDLACNVGAAWVAQGSIVRALEKQLAEARLVEAYLCEAREQIKSMEGQSDG